MAVCLCGCVYPREVEEDEEEKREKGEESKEGSVRVCLRFMRRSVRKRKARRRRSGFVQLT